MPRKTKRQKQLSRARTSTDGEEAHSTRFPWSFGRMSRKRVHLKVLTTMRANNNRTIVPNECSLPKSSPQFNAIIDHLWGPLEVNEASLQTRYIRRFLAIRDLAFLQGACLFLNDSALSEAYRKVSELHGVSLKRLRLWESASQRGRLGRLPGSGRTRRFPISILGKWLEKTVVEADGDMTGRSIAIQLKQRFGFGSEATVSRLLRRLGYRRRKRRFVPLLQPRHMDDRLKWAESKLSSCYDPSIVEIHIDEKWFVSFRQGGVVLVPPGVQLRPKVVASKRHPAQQMFLAAIAEPRKEHRFDGKIAFIPVTKRVVAKRNSGKRERGEEYEKSATMTKERFLYMIKNSIVPAAVNHVHKWAKQIVIQMDNAGGHGGGRAHMATGTLADLSDWFSNLKEAQKLDLCPLVSPSSWPLVSFISQPARSPDLNALDLGAWWSIEKAVGDVSKKLEDETWIDAVTRQALEAWNVWDSKDKCSKIFSALKTVWEQILVFKGGNDFAIPHQTEKRKI